MTRTTAATALFILSLLTAAPALAQEQPKAPCGGDLGAFLDGVRAEAMTKGIPADAIDRALAGAQIDKKVLSRDRGQGVFRQTFLEFSKRTVSQARLDIGRQKMKQYADTFAKAEADYGVPAPVIVPVNVPVNPWSKFTTA